MRLPSPPLPPPPQHHARRRRPSSSSSSSIAAALAKAATTTLMLALLLFETPAAATAAAASAGRRAGSRMLAAGMTAATWARGRGAGAQRAGPTQPQQPPPAARGGPSCFLGPFTAAGGSWVGGRVGGVRGFGSWPRPPVAGGGSARLLQQQPPRPDMIRGRASSLQRVAAERGTRRKTTGAAGGGGGSGGAAGKDAKPAPAIVLSAEERELFETLLCVVEDEQLGTTLRVAGGWVRDKVLGQWAPDGHVDIDIALDNMMGSEFAATLNRWMAKRGREMLKVGIISQNPEKSKHLETATMRVGSFWIDFVNLRTESYTDGSRIPLMDIGGPEEDALRRDLTINSLFYNVNSGEIEDFSGRGLADMRDGIIRTPLPPLTTLLDDPLRVLRAIRFASRLDFRMSPELTEAASDPRVHRALAQKVSRERIGSEVDLMMRSARPTQAMTLIGELGLAATVFPAPEDLVVEEGGAVVGGVDGVAALPGTWYRLGLKAISEMEMGLRFKSWGLSADEVRLALYAALLLPLAPVRYLEKRKKPVEVSRYVFSRMLKLRAKDADKVSLLYEVVDGFRPFLADAELQLEPKEKRARIGALLLQAGPLWRAAVLLAAVKASVDAAASTSKPNHREAAARIYAYVTEAGLDAVWDASPPFDGEALREVLPGIPHGPPFRRVMDTQVGIWLRDPEVSREEMQRRLVDAFPEFAVAADGDGAQ